MKVNIYKHLLKIILFTTPVGIGAAVTGNFSWGMVGCFFALFSFVEAAEVGMILYFRQKNKQ